LSIALVIAAMTMWGCGGRAAPVRTIDRHEALVEIHPDGSVLVTERLEGALFADNATLERVVGGDRADAIEYAGSSMDGLTWSDAAAGPLKVMVETGQPLYVRWDWAGTDSPPTSMHWRYRVTGATGLRERRGVVLWPVLASPRYLSINTSRIELRLPESIQMLRGTGMAETGWTIDVRPRGMVATRDGVGLDRATLLAEFPVDTSRVGLPQWQINDDLQGEFAPAFVSAALFMLVIGGGVVWIIRFQHPVRRVSIDKAVAILPDGLSGEARRALRRGAAPRDARVTRELLDRGLIDPERLSVGTGLRTTAFVGTVVALLCALLSHLVLWRFDWWPQIVPASMIVVAILFLVFASRFRVLTIEGERLRARLRG
jgi:hypothetical protein